MTLTTLAFLLLYIGMALLAGAIQTRYRRLAGLCAHLLVTYSTLLIGVIGAEAYFRYVYADSAWLWTRAGENWHNRYIHNNRLGYRDREWQPSDWQGKRTVMVVGDSFTQGFGIEDPHDRYSDVLANLLGDEWAVMNLGVPDSSTRDQLHTLRTYPLQTPDVIIWQYLLNDINDAGLSIGDHWWPHLPTRQPPLIHQSHLANFLYWRLAPAFTTVDVTEGHATYWDWAYYAYDNVGIWSIHQQEILDLLTYINSTRARLIVVIFPNIQQPVESIAYVDRVKQFLEANGVNQILPLYNEVAEFVDQRGSDKLLVSPRDAHPSADFHRFLGQRIYERYFASLAPPSPQGE